MKKGFILALLMVAMVAMVLPVSARAPIVAPLPTIIIGDADDAATSGAVQVGILRYTDALDLLDPTKIDWNNPTDIYPADTYHAYLLNPATGAPEPNILPYDSAGIIDLITDAEFADLLADGTAPAASARITGTLSLFDASRHPAITDPANADPATEGEILDSYTSETTLLFVAAVESVDSGRLAASDLGEGSSADSVSPIKVVSQSGATDATEAAVEPVETWTFEGSTDGWTFQTLAGFTALAQVGGAGETGVGFNQAAAAGAGLTYASWLSPSTISGSSQNEGRVYRAVAQLSSTAASSDLTPGWRLTFRNAGFSHYGKVTMDSSGNQPAGEANLPTSSSEYEARLYWVVPYFLGDMGDGEGQAVSPAGDYRLYRVTFDGLATQGDTGRLVMEQMNLSYILRPIDVDAEIEWGTGAGQTAFNAALGNGGWKAGAAQTSLGFGAGNITVNAANVVLAIGGASGLRYSPATSQDYAQVSPFPPVNQLKPVSGRLYRFSFNVGVLSRAAVPTYRCNINGLNQVPLSNPANRKMSWGEYFAYSNIAGVGKLEFFAWDGQSTSVCPGAPGVTASPTSLETYVWSHSVAPQTESFITTIVPLLSVVDVGTFQEAGSVWADPTTNMTFSNAKWEDLGSDY